MPPEAGVAIARPAAPRGGVREACLKQALAIIEESGVEALSFREVSRRLGVSHQAPYKHFANRDDILAELLTRCFADFARHLEARGRHADPAADMAGMGLAYFDYARRHPTRYKLMFETPMPKPEDHPAMMQESRRAFGLLQACLAAMPAIRPVPLSPRQSADLDALFVWSTVHGLSSIMHSDIMATLGFSEWEMHAAAAHVLSRIGMALGVRDASPRGTI